MANDELKVGDVVTLKSGGPKMTIESIDVSAGGSHKMAYCVWFDEKKIRQESAFQLTSLEK